MFDEDYLMSNTTKATYGNDLLYQNQMFGGGTFNAGTDNISDPCWNIDVFLPQLVNQNPMPNSCLSYSINILLAHPLFKKAFDIYKCIKGLEYLPE